MNCLYSLRLVSWGIALSIIAVGIQASAAPPDQDLTRTIADQHRSIRGKLSSFRAKYTMSIKEFAKDGTHQRSVSKEGDIAFAGQRVFSSEVFPLQKYSYCYVENGTRARSASLENPRLVTNAKSGNNRVKKGSPGPWEIFCDGISARLDSLAPEEGRIVSVTRDVVNDRPVIVVEVEVPANRLGLQDPRASRLRILYSSEKDGYAPLEFTWDGPAKTGIQIRGKTTNWFRHTTHDGAVILPLDYNEQTVADSVVRKEMQWKMSREQVEINPDLPDGLFRIDIMPDDQVVDVDLDLELYNPFGRDLLGLDTRSTSDSPKQRQTTDGVSQMPTGVARTHEVAGDAQAGSKRKWIVAGLLVAGVALFGTLVVVALRRSQRSRIERQ